MKEIGTQDPLHAARHEAGHAVTGLLRGSVPRAIRLREENGLWFGDCDFGPTRITAKMSFSVGTGGHGIDITDVQNHIAKSVAGVLAQSRTIAEEEVGKALRFVIEANLGGLLHIFLKERRSGNDVKAGACGLSFTLTESGKVIPFTMDGAWLSGADIGRFRMMAKEFMADTERVSSSVVRGVMHELNNTETWQAVISLGDHLLAQHKAGDPPKYVLEGEALSETIRHLGLPTVNEDDV